MQKTFLLLCCALFSALLVGCTANSSANKADYRPDEKSIYYTAMGKEYLRRKQYSVALERLQVALDLDDRNAEAHNTLAILHERLNQKKQAETHYLRALTLSPDASEIHNDYGRFLCRFGRIDEAEKHFTKAVSNPLYRKPQLVWTNAGLCATQMKQYEKAKNYFAKVLDSQEMINSNVLKRALGISLYQMAEINQKQHHYKEAMKHFSRYEKSFSHNAQTLWLGLKIQQGLGNNNKEADYALRLKSEFPHSKQAENLQ